MVEQCDVIRGVGVPSVGSANRRARLAGIALIHRDDAKLLREFDRRIERALVPELDARAHPARREQQDWVSGTEFLKVKAHITAFENRHEWLSSRKLNNSIVRLRNRRAFSGRREK